MSEKMLTFSNVYKSYVKKIVVVEVLMAAFLNDWVWLQIDLMPSHSHLIKFYTFRRTMHYTNEFWQENEDIKNAWFSYVNYFCLRNLPLCVCVCVCISISFIFFFNALRDKVDPLFAAFIQNS